MKRNSLLALLVLVTLFATGCSGPNHEEAIRQRFKKGAGHLCRGEVDACIPLVNPAFVRQHGENGTRIALGIASGVFKIFNVTEADIRIDQIVVGGDGKTAQVQFSLLNKINGEWKPQKPSNWVNSEGQWYLDL